MFQSPTTSAATPRVTQDAESAAVQGAITDATVLITAQEVMFGTAAAISPRRPSPSRRLIGAVQGFGAALLGPPAQRHYPQRTSYLERSRMAREMDRL